jgi:aldose 1-epimerase
VRVQPFGECEVGPVSLVTLGGEPGPTLEVMDLGATTHSLVVTGGDGIRRNVVLGHPTAAHYLASTAYLGATVGRYANRIAGGAFSLDGRPVQVGVNDRGNSLHGGPDGFDRRLWTLVDGDETSAVLRLESPDGDQGFPGALVAEVRYAVLPDGVRIELAATTDAPTVVNLTNHTYFNLAGEGSGSAEGHLIQVPADEYLPVDATGIPLGVPAPVDGTPFDLRAPTRVGDVVRRNHPQLRDARGIDHNVAPTGRGSRRVATLTEPTTGTTLDLVSDQPGLQVYTGNFLDGSVLGTSGGLYRQGDGIALEPQVFPDSPNHPSFPSPVLRPGERYTAVSEWRFGPVA